jgi:hyperosmotically inducible protein
VQNALLSGVLAAGMAAAGTKVPVSTDDASIAKGVLHQIRSYPYYTIWDDLSFRVNNGTVTLTGDVSQPFKKADLGRAVAKVPGVTTVDNEIKVEPLSPFDNQLRRQVARAIFSEPSLSRYAAGVIPSIHIIVENGHVTLDGVVANQMDKQIAGMRANTSMSLGTVTNNLQVENPSNKKS